MKCTYCIGVGENCPVCQAWMKAAVPIVIPVTERIAAELQSDNDQRDAAVASALRELVDQSALDMTRRSA